MRVGFTGTRYGMTPAQHMVVQAVLEHYAQGEFVDPTGPPLEFHHGDCLGADEEAATIAYTVGDEKVYTIVCHPPKSDTWRAYTTNHDVLHDPKDYHERNRAIVESCDVLVAAPIGPDIGGSGTWGTVKYAKQREVPVVIVWPSGREEHEGEQ